jgi:molecular chaperone Hsp33
LREVDRLRRFLFENAPLRGHWLRLEDAWAQAREHQSHPPVVMQLLGQAFAAVSLLAATLKFQGTLTLQIRGQGPLSLLITQCTHDQQLRGVAQLREDAVVPDAADLPTLVGDGHLVVTIDNAGGGPPWQGIVPLSGATLADCLQGYFATSEQLPTRLVLAADAHRVAGLLLQKLPTPASAGEGEAGRLRDLWDEAALLLGTLEGRELLDTEAPVLLTRLFAEHDLRLFDAEPVRFGCRCSPERVAGLLQSLGEAEVGAVIAEQGMVTVTCEFCHRPYRYDAIDVAQLFAASPAADVPDSLN